MVQLDERITGPHLVALMGEHDSPGGGVHLVLDPVAAGRVILADDEVDRDNADIIAGLIARMQADPNVVEPAMSLFTAVRNLERIADHATNIAEDVIYLVRGEMVRHHPEALGGQ